MKIPHLTHSRDAAIIRRLVERFFDGDTSPAQEQAIYDYYATHQGLPDDLERYRPMFGWYSAMSSPVRRRRPLPRFAGIAAALAMLVVVGVVLVRSGSSADERLYASYRGSYVIRDGQRIDDIQLIYSNLACAEQMADSLIDLADREARNIEQSPDDILVDRALDGIDDPELALEIKKAILE